MQARNQEFFRAGKFSSNQVTLINIQLEHEKERPRRKKINEFPLETLKYFISNEKLYPQMTTIRAFFLQIRVLFPNFRKRAGETSPYSLLQLRVFFKIDFLQLYLLSLKNSCKGVHFLVTQAAFACNFIKKEFLRIYYQKILNTTTEKQFSYLQSNFFKNTYPINTSIVTAAC